VFICVRKMESCFSIFSELLCEHTFYFEDYRRSFVYKMVASWYKLRLGSFRTRYI